MRFVIRAFLAVLLFLAALVVIAFLVIVDIVDGISRNQDRQQTTGAVLQDLTSSKPSRGD